MRLARCQEAAWDASRASFVCRSCNWGEFGTSLVRGTKQCSLLKAVPELTKGFRISTGMAPSTPQNATGGLRGFAKHGWLGTEAGAYATFAVPPRSRILVAMLCSYENVGTVRASLTRAPDAANLAAAVEAAGRVDTLPGMPLELQWDQHSSQQCLADVGTTGDSTHLLVLHVTSARSGGNQVKLMGIYEQYTGSSPGEDAPRGAFREFLAKPGALLY